jgi:hypothetical protein
MINRDAPSLRMLIDKAEVELFAGIARDQRPHLAEAWSNFRRGAALLAEVERGRVPEERLHQALERVQAGLHALLALTARSAQSGA